MNRPLPTAAYMGPRAGAALASVPLLVMLLWGLHQGLQLVAIARGKSGSPMALTFAVAFALLWWLPLSWLEVPWTTSRRTQAQLDALVVTVHLPVYNEDAETLRCALASVLGQSRLPQRVHVVDDGSTDEHGYDLIKAWFLAAAAAKGIEVRWVRTINRGKRHAQMETLASDDADIYVTLDSDSTLDEHALEEGLKPFKDPKVTSVAGMVVVWNSRANALTRLTCLLYTPFTRGFRPAQSVLGQVMVNSGTLAFYRAGVVRAHAGAYEHETFRGRAMQMNDDSMLTFYGMLEGKTVHQPTSVAFTVVPETFRHYANQQLRWMRGTFVRTGWWFRYLPMTKFAWWMPAMELVQLLLGLIVLPVGYAGLAKGDPVRFWASVAAVGVALNYLCALRYFAIKRSDESRWLDLATFALAPVAGIWRLVFLRPMIVYAMATFWKVGRWGTRAQVEVKLAPAALVEAVLSPAAAPEVA